MKVPKFRILFTKTWRESLLLYGNNSVVLKIITKNIKIAHFFTGCLRLEYKVLNSEEGEKGKAVDLLVLVGVARKLMPGGRDLAPLKMESSS